MILSTLKRDLRLGANGMYFSGLKMLLALDRYNVLLDTATSMADEERYQRSITASCLGEDLGDRPQFLRAC
jgi:hypothetical protein